MEGRSTLFGECMAAIQDVKRALREEIARLSEGARRQSPPTIIDLPILAEVESHRVDTKPILGRGFAGMWDA